MLRYAPHVIKELIGGISTEIGIFNFRGRRSGTRVLDIVDPVVDNPN